MHDEKLIVAHRGVHTKARENTLEAFESAVKCGVEMLEFDVRRTIDGELVIHHNEGIGDHLLSTIDYPRAIALTADLGYHIPRLEETLELLAGRIRLDVEIKEAHYETAVLAMLQYHLRSEDFLITSFLAETVSRMRSLSPAVRLGLLVSDVSGSRALEMFHQTGADLLAPEYVILNEETFAQAARSRIPLLPWTVNDAGEITRCLEEPSVLGLITDEPAKALQIRRALAADWDSA
jgi:glycerophosphoryl diester phosphodiesterase